MAEEKQKKTRSAVTDPEPEESVQNTEEVKSEAENTVSTDESGGEEIVLSGETLAEIGEPDKELVFKRIAKAYEEAKRKREKYKKIGPIFVAASGVIFLTLIFTLENKITFLILWVITVLYTVALMIRAEYKYHQFQCYLGLNEEESDSEEDEQSDPQSVEPEKDISQNAEQEEQA